MLAAGVQTQLQHVAHAERVGFANREVRHGEGNVGREVIDRVNAPGQFVEGGLAQAQTRLADISGHHADARREGLVPDLSLLQGRAQAL